MAEQRVFGPPGTGKTAHLTAAITGAAARYGADRVLVASFTRAAAATLVSRGLPITPDHVGTLHAMAYRALGRPRIAEAATAEWNQCHSRFRLSAAAVARTPDEPVAEEVSQTRGDVFYGQYERLRGARVPAERWPPAVAAFAHAWEAWKQDGDLLDFTDLIEQGLRFLERAPDAPAVGFYDEAQDFSPLELALVRQWGEHMDSYTLCGDDDQAIFTFKGVSPAAFLRPAIPAQDKQILTQSYRVPRAVHGLATRWIQRVQDREAKVYRPRPSDGRVRRLAAATWAQPERVVAELEQQCEAGRRVMLLASCG
jgi:DNA helicase-2/ATP-dependent DNA helicase PcrA